MFPAIAARGPRGLCMVKIFVLDENIAFVKLFIEKIKNRYSYKICIFAPQGTKGPGGIRRGPRGPAAFAGGQGARRHSPRAKGPGGIRRGPGGQASWAPGGYRWGPGGWASWAPGGYRQGLRGPAAIAGDLGARPHGPPAAIARDTGGRASWPPAAIARDLGARPHGSQGWVPGDRIF